jgi:RNA polymerase sigma factor (sigma-70 family)
MTSKPPLPLENLLAQTDWVTLLARALVADSATAEDIAQSTWLSVLRNPQPAVGNPRAWLAAIVRRQVQRLRRTDARRNRREQIASTANLGEHAPAAEDLAAKVAIHRELVDAVLALAEPYRETVVLRYFENLDLDAIATRTHSKRNTVRSRLQRGLQQLREQLDRAPGGRERWLPGVLLLGRRQMATAAAGAGAAGSGVAAGIALAITMKKVLLSAAAIVAGLFLIPSLFPDSAPGVPPGNQPDRVNVRAEAPSRVPTETAATGSNADVQRSSVALSASPPLSAPRRLVDRDGNPLANVVLRAETPDAVRWQGGDRGWISGPDRSLRISKEEEERLRADEAFAQQFFAQFAAPDEWRATVLGSPLPAREASSAADGSFEFPPELACSDPAITVADPNHVLISRGSSGSAPWVAGPAARITGTVRTPDGLPLPDAFAIALATGAEGAVELPEQIETRTDDDGTFLIRRALANGLLRVRHKGFLTQFVATNGDPDQRPEIVLQPRPAHESRVLDGTVVDGSGRPIGDASVWFGRQKTKTDRNGHFALPADDPRPQYALTIVATGYALLQQDDFGAALALPATPTQDLLFVLTKRPVTARGIVLGSDGAPLAGALVGLVDPTLLDISFESIEARVGGWGQGTVANVDGTFSLTGLAERAYRFQAVDPATGAIARSAPVRAMDGDVILRMPRDLRRAVRGSVRKDGRGVASASVAVAFCTYITKGGGTQFDTAAEVPCDASGGFLMPAIPRTNAWFQVRVAGSVQHMVPVESLPDATELVIDIDDTRWLQLVGSAHPAPRTIHFELSSGRCVSTTAVLAPDGTAPALQLPADAVAVVLDHERPTARRLELTDDRAVLLRVR